MPLWISRKVIKRCPEGHEMEVSWRTCPRCTGRARTAPSREMSDLTMVAEPARRAPDAARGPEPEPAGAAAPADAIARLTATTGPLAGQELRVRAGRTKLGKAPREEPGSVVLPIADPYTSKDHLALIAGEGGVVMVDLGSTNGTFVNGQRVGRAVLRDGDELRLGQTTLTVTLNRGG